MTTTTTEFGGKVLDASAMPGPSGLFGALRTVFGMHRSTYEYMFELNAKYANSSMTPVRFDAFGQGMVFVTDPRHIKRVVFEGETFTRNINLESMKSFKRALGRNIVNAPEHEYHALKKRTLKYFSGKALNMYGDVVVSVLQSHGIPRFSRMAETGDSCDLLLEMLEIASLAAFKSFLGDDCEPPRSVYMALNDMFSYVRQFSFYPWLPPLWWPLEAHRNLKTNMEMVHNFLRPRIETDKSRETMMGDVIRANTDERGRVDAERVLQEVTALLVGASETTIVMMTFLMYYLSCTPDAEEKLLAEVDRVIGRRPPTVQDLKAMPYLLQAAHEALRLRSPAYLYARYTTKDTELGGYRIAKNNWVFACQYITHLDPRFWASPNEFRPERWAPESPEAPANRRDEMPFFPFGGGSFVCLGQTYAINEAALMAATVLQHFRLTVPTGLKCVPDPGIDARLTVRPAKPILLRVEARG